MAGVPNPDFFMQFNIEQQAVYINVNLNNYINKDPLVARQKILKDIEDEQNELIIELEQLRRIKTIELMSYILYFRFNLKHKNHIIFLLIGFSYYLFNEILKLY